EIARAQLGELHLAFGGYAEIFQVNQREAILRGEFLRPLKRAAAAGLNPIGVGFAGEGGFGEASIEQQASAVFVEFLMVVGVTQRDSGGAKHGGGAVQLLNPLRNTDLVTEIDTGRGRISRGRNAESLEPLNRELRF